MFWKLTPVIFLSKSEAFWLSVYGWIDKAPLNIIKIISDNQKYILKEKKI